MPRFYVVRGKPGCGVPTGLNVHERRYVGMRALPPEERPEFFVCHTELFKPVAEVVQATDLIRSAIASEELEVVAGPIGAPALKVAKLQLAEAVEKANASKSESAPAPKKSRGGNGGES